MSIQSAAAKAPQPSSHEPTDYNQKYWENFFFEGKRVNPDLWSTLNNEQRDEAAYVFSLYLFEKKHSSRFSPVEMMLESPNTYEALIKHALFHYLRKKLDPKSILRLIKDHKASLDWQDTHGNYPFDYVLTHQKSDKLFNTLLRLNPKYNQKCLIEISSIQTSCQKRDLEHFKKTLLLHIHYINQLSTVPPHQSNQLLDYQIIAIGNLLLWITHQNDQEFIKVFKEAFSHLNNDMNTKVLSAFCKIIPDESHHIYYKTALTSAIDNRNIEMIAWLLKNNAPLHIQVSETQTFNQLTYLIVNLISSNFKVSDKLRLSQLMLEHISRPVLYKDLLRYISENPEAYNKIDAFSWDLLNIGMNWVQKFNLFYFSMNGINRRPNFCSEGADCKIILSSKIISVSISLDDNSAYEIEVSDHASPVPSKAMRDFLYDQLEKDRSNTERYNELTEAFQNECQMDVCPISLCIPDIPVRLDGHLFDFCSLTRISVNEEGKRLNPLTRAAFKLEDIQPDKAYQNALEAFFNSHESQPTTESKPLLFAAPQSDASAQSGGEIECQRGERQPSARPGSPH